MIDLENPVVKLCVAGSQAEFEKRIDDAKALYRQAWEIAADDYEATIAAHYVARHQENAQQTLHWNQIALERAEAADDERVQPFFGSLYVNMGHSYEVLGDIETAQRYYALAAERGVVHQAKQVQDAS